MVDIIRRRLKCIFTAEDFERCCVNNYRSTIVVTLDVHGLSCKKAARLIRNVINLVSCSFRLVVIHGYNHGTAIKDMLAKDFYNPNIEVKYVDPYNPGITHIQVA